MSEDLKKIHTFIKEHHVLTLATSTDNEISACSLFYAYDEEKKTFVVASSEETLHIQHVRQNNHIAGNILLETSEVGKIQGLQFRGVMEENSEKNFSQLYFKTFPYALALTPKLWTIKVDFLKLTDNRLGFGKKIIWP
ncbi:pyridoxamine 5'-phosphate oxidase family protein [Sulfurimonas sp. C5]|uniref:pyridoxamine 5'-phosphate oxidase family protein n=1 Tax=Sulfurimonas sp. C5 TaxID=3036947 RepID=UPI002458BE6F|nr:pyridoxamine 5'-phosphate oxidase family protein [Sulfurimonas sp. C5]MDH4945132.1 pyridoxamine 5'-phosphate oxidase family protein [Sulfurimonas sp. C5]